MPAASGQDGVRQINCGVCGCSDSEFLCWGRDRWLNTPGTFRVVKCRGCGVVYLNPQPSMELLAAYYPAGYYAFRKREDSPARSWRKRLSTNARRWWELRAVPRSFGTGNALDIGCGSGWFLETLQGLGWKPYGVEPGSGAIAAREAGWMVVRGSLHDAGYPGQFFQYVRARHVFEHLPNPIETLREVHRIAAPGSLIEITIPNASGLNARLFGSYWHQLDVPRHLYNYGSRLLVAILERHGFRAIRVSFRKSYMGASLRYYLDEHCPAWLHGFRWTLIHLGLGVIRPLTSAVGRVLTGDEVTVRAVKAEGAAPRPECR